MKSYGVTIQIKATEHYFPVVLFIMLYKVVLTAVESVNEILWCDHSNESYWALLSCGTVYYAVQGNSNFWVFSELLMKRNLSFLSLNFCPLLENFQVILLVFKLQDNLSQVFDFRSILKLYFELDFNAFSVKTLKILVFNALEHAREDNKFVTWWAGVKTFSLHIGRQLLLMDVISYSH